MRFTKMQGAGNDFIILDDRAGLLPREELGALAKRVCTRRLSLGADGLMVVVPPEADGDFRMLFYNNDGTVGEMCGNGARCISRYGREKGLAQGEEVRVETISGTVVGRWVGGDRYAVRLNSPTHLELRKRVLGQEVSYIELGTPGHPHCILRRDDYDALPREELFALGKALRWAEEFPKGANVTFVKKLGENAFRAETFERGVEDFTLACGTGCGSAACALTLLGETDGKNVLLRVPGGDLTVEVQRAGESITLILTGPTALVAEGELYI